MLVHLATHEVLRMPWFPIRDAYDHAVPPFFGLGCPDLEPAHVADFPMVAGDIKVRHLITSRRHWGRFGLRGFRRCVFHHFLAHENAVFVCSENSHYTPLSQIAGATLETVEMAGAVVGRTP